MAPPLAYHVPGAIGGPMKLGEGYRWNVPVITYGYDKSFLDYFGTNGVAQVESAIQIFNSLPPASQIVLTNYPVNTTRQNFIATSQSLVDLKSTALVMLEEQLGLAQPSLAVYCLTNFSYADFDAEFGIDIRNYDPVRLIPWPIIDSTFYGHLLVIRTSASEFDAYPEPGNSWISFGPFGTPYLPVGEAYNLNSSIDTEGIALADYEPNALLHYAANNFPLQAGDYFSGLTFDDAGGISYQFSTNNIKLESLIPGVYGAGTNASNYINKAFRPGVDKITFQRMQYTSDNEDSFIPVTNDYIDTYITNDVLQHQKLERVITRPDILFTVNYIGVEAVSCSGTTNWVNNGLQNDGPGVIQPPVTINFNRLGSSLEYNDPNYTTNGVVHYYPASWGSFDGTTNAPNVLLPPVTNVTDFHFLLFPINFTPNEPQEAGTWSLMGQSNALFSIQTSTDLSNWLTIGTITNVGGTFTYLDSVFPNTPQRYFRTVPQGSN
jgi:hypothetical protein